MGIALLVGLIIFLNAIRILSSKNDLHDKYLALRRFKLLPLAIVFLVPYLFIYLWLARRLGQLRDEPRFSKLNGKAMHKLKEEEEDDYLEKGQITEEEIGSVDYDVWITDNADDILILRYAKWFSKYKGCPSCKYKTYYLARSVVVSPATYSSSGSRREDYECKNCSYTDSKYKTIPRKQRSSGGGGIGGGGGGGSSWGGGSSGGGGAGVSW